MSKGEFTSVAQANGGIDAMLDPNCKDQDTLALIRYIAEEDKLEKILENPQVIKTPVVRNGKQSTLGYQPDVWKKWEQGLLVTMLEQQFRLKYSEIMENFQCIEYDLKRIYSAMSADDFDENMDMLEFSNMGRTLRDLEEMDNSDGNPYLSEADYDTLDAIRELRNYWEHQCYLDWVYCQDSWEKNTNLQKAYNRLVNESNRVAKLQSKLERFYLDTFCD